MAHSNAYEGWVVALAITLGTLSASGCAGSKPKGECPLLEKVNLAFDTYPELNHDRDGYSRSVVVRVYQLDDLASFEKVDFDALWQSAELSGAVAGPDELTVVPGHSQTESINRKSKANFLGLAANFREPGSQESWKTSIRLPPAQDPCSQDGDAAPFKVGLILANYTMRVR